MVINDLLASRHDDTGVAYIYFDHEENDVQRREDLLASLLKQLAARDIKLVKELYDHHQEMQTKPKAPELLRTLELVIQRYKQTFVILDALDECQTAEKTRYLFLRDLFEIQKRCGIKLLATSRFVVDIEEHFEGRPKLEICARPADIELFLAGPCQVHV